MESTDTVLDQTMVESINSTMKTLGDELGDWGSSLLPIIGGIVGVFILFWVFKLGLRIVKSFATSSK